MARFGRYEQPQPVADKPGDGYVEIDLKTAMVFGEHGVTTIHSKGRYYAGVAHVMLIDMMPEDANSDPEFAAMIDSVRRLQGMR